MRAIDVATLAAMTLPNVRMALLAELHFTSGVTYAWTGAGQFSYGGNTYYGLGTLASVSPIQESSDVRSDGIVLGLSGIDPTMISEVLTEVQQGLPCILSVGFFDDNTNLIGTPVIAFSGFMDQPQISEGTDTCTVTIACENRMAQLQMPRERRYTDQEQRRDYPNDAGFMYVNAIQNWNSTWGH